MSSRPIGLVERPQETPAAAADGPRAEPVRDLVGGRPIAPRRLRRPVRDREGGGPPAGETAGAVDAASAEQGGPAVQPQQTQEKEMTMEGLRTAPIRAGRQAGTRASAMRRLVTAMALTGALATPAFAVDEEVFLIDTTADLARLCGAQPGADFYAQAVQMCQGYMMGVHHFHEALALELDNDIYCDELAPTRPTRNEIMESFTAWVAATPGVGETEALDGLLQWAAQTFPCE